MTRQMNGWLWRQRAAEYLFRKLGGKSTMAECWGYSESLKETYRDGDASSEWSPEDAVAEDMSYWNEP